MNCRNQLFRIDNYSDYCHNYSRLSAYFFFELAGEGGDKYYEFSWYSWNEIDEIFYLRVQYFWLFHKAAIFPQTIGMRTHRRVLRGTRCSIRTPPQTHNCLGSKILMAGTRWNWTKCVIPHCHNQWTVCRRKSQRQTYFRNECVLTGDSATADTGVVSDFLVKELHVFPVKRSLLKSYSAFLLWLYRNHTRIHMKIINLVMFV